MTRALRILLVANDGFSAGHVVRTLAIARGLARGAASRGIELQTVLATTSEADALLAPEPIAVVRLPAPARARLAGLSDPDRRRLVAAAIEATADTFAPDLIVVDTFPNGPHGELAGISRSCKRALVRRAVPDERVELLTTGLDRYDRLILVDDAGFAGTAAEVRSVIVPPITLGNPVLDRAVARRALGVPASHRAIAVAAGGGGDLDGIAIARALAHTIARLDRDATVVLALGPLAPVTADSVTPSSEKATQPMRALDRRSAEAGLLIEQAAAPTAIDGLLAEQSAAPTWAAASLPSSPVPTQTFAVGSGATEARIRELRVAPLEPYLAAFDAVVSSAGYNTAHELAAARVPAILFPLPRPFDDQAGRALRLTAAGHAYLLAKRDDAEIIRALAWAREATCPGMVTGGADRAADALFELMGVR